MSKESLKPQTNLKKKSRSTKFTEKWDRNLQMQKKSPRPLYISWKSLHLRKPSMNLTREEYMAESY